MSDATRADARLPHNERVERAFLVIPMLNPDTFDLARALVPSDEVFYLERHQAIWKAECSLRDKGLPLDERTLEEEIKAAGKYELVGGIAYLAGLSLDLPLSGLENAEHYGRILRELWAKRRLVMLGSSLSSEAMNGKPADEILSSASASISSISAEQAQSSGARQIRESILDFDRWEPVPDGLLGFSSGFSGIDRMTLGLEPGLQTVIAARPSMGKSSLALCVATRASRAGARVVFHSLEMPEQQCRDRILAAESGVSLRAIRTGRLGGDQKDRIRAAMNRVAPYPLWIDDRPALSMGQISAAASVHKMRHGLDVLFVDYLGLVRYVGKQDSEVNQLGDMAREMREIGRSLACHTVLLHQLSRSVESRSDHRPRMADLRGSGKIEEHADTIAFLYRDEVYNKDDLDIRGIAELLFEKQRQGETGMVPLAWISDQTSFLDLDSGHADTPF